MRDKPIIYIHYGDSFYLKYILQFAIKNNPDKDVVLLGDKNNEHYKSLGIKHFHFDNYQEGEELKEFDSCYKFIAGETHGRHFWTNFVFRKIYFIYNFVKHHNISTFWTFDSDYLILKNLNNYENLYMHYDCTEQNKGSSMQGIINNIDSLRDYLISINDQFKDDDYINKQKEDFKENPHFAYTEMRAYLEYKRRTPNLKRIELREIINNKSFDDGLFLVYDYQVYDKKHIDNLSMKKIFHNSNGKLFMKKNNNEFIELNGIDMSWAPEYLYQRIIHHHNLHSKETDYRLISNFPTIKHTFQHQFQLIKGKIYTLYKRK